MDWTNQHKSLLHDGVSKRLRRKHAPQPDLFQPEGSDTATLLQLAQQWAAFIKYYNVNNEEAGSWAPFLEGDVEEFCQYLDHPDSFANDPVKTARLQQPHFTLFLGFLKLYNIPRDAFNQLTHRHLNYFYRSYLNIAAKKPVPDNVHVRFELDEATPEHGLPAGTCLTAGTDEEGETLEYYTQHEIIVNHAEVADCFSLCRSNENFIQLNQAPPECLELAPNPEAWDPFYSPEIGSYTHARLGLAVASPLFLFDEGSLRTITLTLICPVLRSELPFFSQPEDRLCKIQLTTTEGLQEVPPYQEQDQRIQSATTHFQLELPEEYSKYNSEAKSNQPDELLEIPLTLKIALNDKFPAVVPLEEVRADLPRHDWPLLCLEWLKTPPGYFKQVQIAVQAKGLKQLIAENNEGRVDTDAAFLPFGSAPRIGNQIKITHPELVNKPVDTIDIKFDWSNDDLNSKEELQAYLDPLFIVAEGMQGDEQINIEREEIGQVQLVFHEPSGLEDIFRDAEPDAEDSDETGALSKFYITEHIEEAKVKTPLGKNDDPLLSLGADWNALSIDNVAHVKLELQGEGVLFEHYEQLQDELAIQKQQIKDYLSGPSKVDELPPKSRVTVRENDSDYDKKEYTVSYELENGANKDDKDSSNPEEPDAAVTFIAPRTFNLSEGRQTGLKGGKPVGGTYSGNGVTDNGETYSFDPAKAEVGIHTITYTLNDGTSASGQARVLPDSLPDPYIPEINQAYIGYTTHLDSEDHYAHTWMDLYSLHPFGYEAFELEPPNNKVVWEPPLAPAYDEPGTLYIGLENVTPPQDISILFEMLEGTAIPEAPEVRLKWEYLKSDDRWAAPSGGAPPVHLRLHDDTHKLTHSGTINFAIPADASLDSQLLPKGLAWLRVSIFPEALIPYKNELITGAICHLRSIHTQTVLARLRDDKYADTHYQQPLPPDSVEAFADPIAEIVDLQQFYPSFEGQSAEQPDNYQMRISERLRHKNRALTLWDYERLVLEHFPHIYKAKCLPTVERAGEVTVVVIPDLNYAKPHDPLYPKASRGQLSDIKNLLSRHIPPFTKLKVVNPHYETLQVEFQVKFMPGIAQGHALRRLREDLVRYLSPWAFDPVADVELDKTIYRGAVTQYIQQLPYVEFLAKLDLFRLDARGKPEGPFAELIARRPDTVWVSDREHPIYVLQGEMPQEGIGVMSVDFDFKVFPRKKGKK